MSLARTYVLSAAPYWRQAMTYIDAEWLAAARSGRPLVVSVSEDRLTRTTAQNARLWAMLADVAGQVVWHGQCLSSEEWKDVFTAALKRQRVAPGIDGGFVVMGTSTRRMTIAQMSELMELIAAFGADHGVRFTEQEQTA